MVRGIWRTRMVEGTVGMTAETTEKPTTHEGILSWVEEVAELTQPDNVYWCTGSEEEWVGYEMTE